MAGTVHAPPDRRPFFRCGPILALLLLASVPVLAGEPPEARYARGVREGIEAFRSGRYEEAVQAFQKALEIKQEAGTWFNLGAAQFRLKNLDEARRAFDETLRMDGAYREAHRFLGRIAYMKKDWASCARELSAASSPGGDSGVWKILAVAFERLEDEGNAKRALEMAAMADPGDVEVRSALASAYYRAGAFASALQEFRTALRLAPARGRLYRYLGYTLVALDRERKAIDALETARRLGESDRGLLSALADLYSSCDMPREASRIFSTLLEAEGTTAEDWSRFAELNLRAGDPDGAKSAFLEVLELEPKRTRALISLGNLELRAGKAKAARKWFEKALALNGESEAAWTGLGDVAYRRDDFDRSARHYRKGLGFSPGNGALWKRLGHAEFSAGRFTAAVRAYRRALEFDPGDREAEAYFSASESALRRLR